jgi:hypothetical protein
MTDTPIDQLIAAVLGDPDRRDLLDAAAAAAVTTRDRQLVAIAAAHLDGDADRVDALAREHLVDHPDSVLAARIAAASVHRSITKEKP